MNRYQYLNGSGEHVHQLDGRPLIGTSRVGGILAKPLTYWASGLAVQTFGCPDPKILTRIKNGKATLREKADHMLALESALKVIKGSTVEQYAALIDKAYRAHATQLREKAATGIDLHSELEKYIRDHMKGKFGLYPDEIQPFIAWTEQNVKRFVWSEGHTFSEKLWIGGISDAGCELNSGKFAIIDAKSTKEGYTNQFLQLAGYDLQIEESGIVDADGNHLYTLEKPVSEYYIWAFGGDKPAAYPFYDIAGARKAFQNALELYKFLPQQ